MSDYIVKLAEVGTELDSRGLFKIADAVDSVLITVAKARTILSQYEGGQGYAVQNSRCWGKCYRMKRATSPELPAQEVFMECWKEYQTAVEGDTTEWNKYAETDGGFVVGNEDRQFVQKVGAQIKEGANPGFAIFGELEEIASEPFNQLLASAEVLTKVATKIEDPELQAKIGELVTEIIKEAQSKAEDWGRAIGTGLGGVGGGVAGAHAMGFGAIPGAAAGAAVGGAAGAAVGRGVNNLYQKGKGIYNRLRGTDPEHNMQLTQQFMNNVRQKVRGILHQNPNITSPEMKPQYASLFEQLKQMLYAQAQKLPPPADQNMSRWVEDGSFEKYVETMAATMSGKKTAPAAPAEKTTEAAPGENMAPDSAGRGTGDPFTHHADPISQWIDQNVNGMDPNGSKKRIERLIQDLTTMLQRFSPTTALP